MWVCPTCKSANNDNNKRCFVCGRFPDQKEGTIQFCTKCGKKYIVNIYDRFCTKCGEKYED